MLSKPALLVTPLQLSRPGKSASVGLTPLIDVVFILLLFFMLATDFQRWRVIDIDSMNVETQAMSSVDAPLLVEVGAQNLKVDGKPVTLTLLAGVLKDRLENTPNAAVVVSALTEASVQRLVSVMDVLQDSGITQARLSIQ